MTEDAKQSLTAVVVVTLFFGGGFLGMHFTKGVELPEWGRWVWLATGAVVVVRMMLAWRRARAERASGGRDQSPPV